MNHFHFVSAQVEKTIQFYETYFGFKKIKLLGKTHVLKDKAHFILAIDEGVSPQKIPIHGMHLGFTLNDREKVKNLFDKMNKDGIAGLTNMQEPSDNAAHFYCEDPTGNRIEVGWFRFFSGCQFST